MIILFHIILQLANSISPLMTLKRHLGAVKFQVVPKLHQAPYDV